ncbi:MAG TPA: hypothetical protein PK821_07930, partial [Victivallales bacterium]|nr:hypothetical protein [Victivallales bacterium]
MKSFNPLGKYLFFVFCVFLVFSSSVYSMPANPRTIDIVQPDGKKVKVKMNGDEHFSWHEDVNGYVVQKDNNDGFWKYAVPRKNEAAFDVLPDERLGESNPQAKGLKKRDLPDRKLINEKINKRKSRNIDSNISPVPTNRQPAPKPIDDSEGSSSPASPPPMKIPVSGNSTVKNVVILACFSDQWSGGTVNPQYGRPTAEYVNLFNELNHVSDGALGSVQDYYSENSYGNLSMESIVVPWVQLPQNQAYYGGNDA